MLIILMYSCYVHIQFVFSIKWLIAIFATIRERVREMDILHMFHKVNFLCTFFPTNSALPPRILFWSCYVVLEHLCTAPLNWVCSGLHVWLFLVIILALIILVLVWSNCWAELWAVVSIVLCAGEGERGGLWLDRNNFFNFIIVISGWRLKGLLVWYVLIRSWLIFRYQLLKFLFFVCSGLCLSESLHFQIFRNLQERVEFLLSYADLTVVHEVKDRLQVSELYSFHIQQWVLVRISA